MTDNPKLVEAGMPTFGQSTTTADTLDAAINNNANATSANNNLQVPPDYKSNMSHLAAMIAPTLSKYKSPTGGGSWSDFGLQPDSLTGKFIASYALLTTTTSIFEVKITFPNIKSSHLKLFLEEIIDPDIAQSGIYEALELDTKEVLPIDEITSYFNELRGITTILNCNIPKVQNPYQRILTLPSEVRPFFSGALSTTKPTCNATVTQTYSWDITTTQLLAYAKQIGQLPQLGQYMKILSQSPL